MVSLSSSLAATAVSASATETAAAAAAAPTSSSTTLTPRANIVALLRSRGLLNDVAGEGAEEALYKASTGVYCGFDPTAASLHVGNLLGIVALSWFAAAGHAPVALLGGATGRVGDPSGRSTERPLLSDEEIEANVAGIRRILEELLGRAASGEFTAAAIAEAAKGSPPSSASSPSPAPRILNNLDWFGPITFLEFLRDVGKHARVGAMLSRDSVKSRMGGGDSGSGDGGEEAGRGEGISFTEFAYQLLQGYDFVHLSRSEGVTVQIGGSDQMGNVVAGLDLIRRMGGGKAGEDTSDDTGDSSSSSSRCYGITFPLLTKSDGTKMGKSAGGAVWLAAEKLSPFKFYQYLLSSTPDADVVKFLKMLTFLPLSRIDEVERAIRGEGPGGASYRPNDAQRLLAGEVTRFVHGEEGLEQALRATAALHGKGGGDDSSSSSSSSSSPAALDADTLEAVAGDAPTAERARAAVLGASVVDLLVDVGLQPSKGAARRLVAGGGVRLNNVKVESAERALEEGDLVGGRLVLLASGKKNKLLLKVE